MEPPVIDPTLAAAAVLTASATAALGGLAYTAVCAVVAHRFTTAVRKPPVPPRFGRDAPDAVCFPARDGRATVQGWFFRPGAARGVVVLVHGKDASRGDELKAPTGALTRHLLASGLAVLTIDLRGHGESSPARLTYSEHERFDVLGAVDWLLAQGFAPGSIGLLGASMGATTSLRAAAAELAIGAVVADSPFADFGQMIERQYRKLVRLPRFVLPGALVIGRWLTGVSFADLRPVVEMPALRGRPVLVIHGEADPFVPVEHARAIAEITGAALWVTASTRHLGSYRDVPDLYRAVIGGFFREHLLREGPLEDPHSTDWLTEWAGETAAV
jgi:pimeloyl-ACP methyl ester carboxylesterase